MRSSLVHKKEAHACEAHKLPCRPDLDANAARRGRYAIMASAANGGHAASDGFLHDLL